MAKTALTKYDKKEFYIKGYRADPDNKYGGEDNMETLPLYYDKESIADYLKGLATARDKFGIEHPDPETLTNMLLKEGREDFGANGDFPGTKQGMDLRSKIIGLSPKGSEIFGGDPKYGNSSMAGIFYEKQLAAKSRNKPFLHVWNGGGRMAEQYVKDSAKAAYAATHPKNSELLQFVKQNLGIKDAAPENLVSSLNVQTPEQPIDMPAEYKIGGRVRMI